MTAVNKELALAYQTIEQQNKIHIEFINIAAHELRTPIQPILGTAELLKSEIEEILIMTGKIVIIMVFKLNK